MRRATMARSPCSTHLCHVPMSRVGTTSLLRRDPNRGGPYEG